MAAGDWLLAQELFERGDPEFVDVVRRVHDADALGAFAPRWYADARPAARRMLLDYLIGPLDAFRHEPLVKRLFKLAEAAGDDEAMGRLLVTLDRSVDRVLKTVHHSERQTARTQEEAQKVERTLRSEGYEHVGSWRQARETFLVWGTRSAEALVPRRGTAMPRDKPVEALGPDPRTGRWVRMKVPEWAVRLRLVASGRYRPADGVEPYRDRLGLFRLFSVGTRRYLRRRAWRYFRRLGRQHPERYVPALVAALALYEDADLVDGVALLDRWGLVHALFHHSPALQSKPGGWVPAPGRTLAELEPAPMFAALWRATPAAVLDLLARARCRTVRQWALRLIESDLAAHRPLMTLEYLLGLLDRGDPEVVARAVEWLEGIDGIGSVDPERWLALLDMEDPTAVDAICTLMVRHLRPDRLGLAEAVRLASRRPVPVARLGLEILRTKTPRTAEDCVALLGLVEAESEPVRPDLLRWARGVLSASEHFRSDWVLEFLDSRHTDARAEGWAWLRDEPRAGDDPTIWRRLSESPYDDVRLPLVSELERRLAGRAPSWDGPGPLDPERLRLLWATVLANIHRGSRAKPLVVRQVLKRLRSHPEESPLLLPVLAVAVRSGRGPEWRAGLAAVVQLVARRPEVEPAVRSAFPELRWSDAMT